MYQIKLAIKDCNDIDNLQEYMRLHNINLVLFGEYHGFINQIDVQKRVIEEVKPNYFLYEMLEWKKILDDKDAKKFLSTSDQDGFSVVSSYGQLKPIIKLCRRFDLPIIGCDLKNMGVNNGWRKNKFSKEKADKITKRRELQQAKVINQYVSKGLTFALLGDYHLRKNSFLWQKLKEKKFIVIRPGFKWEERFNDKKKFKDSEISYNIQTISL
ncbi:MAG: hypothetical protein AABX10_03305 [Nanoarchaeota archaeon]